MASSKIRLGLFAGAAGLAALALAAASRRKNVWNISHGKKGYAVELAKVPAWAMLVQDALDVVPCVPRTGWLWQVGFGREPDGELRWSLGGLLTAVCESRHGIVETLETRVAALPVDRDTAVGAEPEAVAEFDRIFADDDGD